MTCGALQCRLENRRATNRRSLLSQEISNPEKIKQARKEKWEKLKDTPDQLERVRASQRQHMARKRQELTVDEKEFNKLYRRVQYWENRDKYRDYYNRWFEGLSQDKKDEYRLKQQHWRAKNKTEKMMREFEAALRDIKEK